MSKDVIIAGSIAVGCIALIAVAFVAPKGKSPVEGEPTKTETTTALNEGSGLGGMPNLETGGQNTFGMPPAYPPSHMSTPPGSNNFGNPPPTGRPQVGNQLDMGNNAFGHQPLPGPAITHVEIAPPAVTDSKSHTVASGEYLGDIAMKYYGSAKAWKKIQDANPGVDAKNLKVGQKLVIPAAESKAMADTGTGTPIIPASGERTYTIKSGDSLYVIAKRELGSASRWKELEKLNNVSSSDLRVGQVIKLPAAAATGGTTGPIPDAIPATGAKTHTVIKGENLGDISKIHYGTTRNWKKIEAANPGVTSDNLKIGQKLVIPEIAGSTSDSTTAGGSTNTEYIVKKGDTPSSIALSELGAKSRVKELQDANPGLDAKNLRVGQKLKIPGKKTDAPIPAPLNPTPFTPPPAPFIPPAGQSPAGQPPTTQAPAPLGAPPAPFPGGDNSFNSPYNNGGNGAGFGQPNQPFGQTGSSFGQTGTSTMPTADSFGVPTQPAPFSPAPPVPAGQALR